MEPGFYIFLWLHRKRGHACAVAENTVNAYGGCNCRNETLRPHAERLAGDIHLAGGVIEVVYGKSRPVFEG